MNTKGGKDQSECYPLLHSFGASISVVAEKLEFSLIDLFQLLAVNTLLTLSTKASFLLRWGLGIEKCYASHLPI